MRLYFAGSDASQGINEVLKACGVTCRLESYFTLKGKEMSKFPHTLLDSGGFSARMRNVEISVSEYAEYINRHQVQLAFELDTNDVEETARNREYLCRHTKATIIPIYHYSDWQHSGTKLLEEFVERFSYIAIGGVAKVSMKEKKRVTEQLYGTVFHFTRDEIKVHGLGITGKKVLEQFPFYSVDSTSWQSFARYAKTQHFSNWRVAKQVANNTHHSKLTEVEVKTHLQTNRYITQLWAERGIVWK